MDHFLDIAYWLFAFVQTFLFVMAAPLFTAWIKWVKCRLQNRTAPSLIQPYWDIRKLFQKDLIIPENASSVFRMTPYLVFGVTVLAASVIPLLTISLPTAAIADMLVLVGFFAFGRFFLALAGMDIGTSFGGMGSSREMTISALAEPAMLMAVFTLAMVAGSTNISTVIESLLNSGIVIRPSFLFILMAMLLVAIAETGRIPIDNPATHLELTMVHEAMILEYNGRHLALLEWASQLKLMIYAVFILNVFFPWGIALHLQIDSLLLSVALMVCKLSLLGFCLAISETVVAKMRLFRVPVYLTLAFILAMLGMLSHNILEVM